MELGLARLGQSGEAECAGVEVGAEGAIVIVGDFHPAGGFAELNLVGCPGIRARIPWAGEVVTQCDSVAGQDHVKIVEQAGHVGGLQIELDVVPIGRTGVAEVLRGCLEKPDAAGDVVDSADEPVGVATGSVVVGFRGRFLGITNDGPVLGAGLESTARAGGVPGDRHARVDTSGAST